MVVQSETSDTIQLHYRLVHWSLHTDPEIQIELNWKFEK